MKLLSRSDEMILLVVWRLQEDAYGVTIRHQLKKITGKGWSIGALHITLERLVNKGYLNSYLSEPTNKRGGRSKRLYRLKPDAFSALQEVKRIQDILWQNFSPYGEEMVYE